jgi:hypothetical protein
VTDAIDFSKPVVNGVAGLAPRFHVLDAPAIAAPLLPLSYLVRGLALVADAGPPHLMAGYGYSGKTVALQSLAVSLAAARQVWGFYPCPDRRQVVHVDYEQGERLTRIRYQRLALGMGVDLAGLGGMLSLVVKPKMVLRKEDAQEWRGLMTGRDLLIVDSLRAATHGRDENDSGIRDVLDMLGDLSEETACRAIVIHHARKPSDGAPDGGRYSIRGSGAIFDACDCAYTLSGEKGQAVKVEHVRAKSYGETVDDFALKISDVEIDGDPKAGLAIRVLGAEALVEQRGAAARDRERRQAVNDAATIRRLLGERGGGVATMALRDLAGLSGARFGRALVELGAAVVANEERRGKSRGAVYYYLREHMPDKGQNPVTGEGSAGGPASEEDDGHS